MAKPTIDWPALLREFRKVRGLKQEAAAELLGVSQPTVSRWERGLVAPTAALRNRLFKALRRERAPLDTLSWLATFRRLVSPAAVSTKSKVLQAVTAPFAKRIGVPANAIEGLSIAEVFGGEILDVVQRTRDEGACSGRVGCVEACVRFDIDPAIARSGGFSCHYVSWPHFTDDGEIVLVSQGRFIEEPEARAVRERLGGPVRYTLAA
jgi:transcriptional regulator with XRE-family HTH domain